LISQIYVVHYKIKKLPRADWGCAVKSAIKVA